MEILAITTTIVSLVGSAVGIIVGVYSVKKLKMEIHRKSSKSERRSDYGQIVLPTLDEVVRYGGSGAKAYQAAMERIERTAIGVLDTRLTFLSSLLSLLSCYEILKMFYIPLQPRAQLDSDQMATAKRVRLLLQLSGVILWVALAIILVVLTRHHMIIALLLILTPFVPLIWSALWKLIMMV